MAAAVVTTPTSKFFGGDSTTRRINRTEAEAFVPQSFLLPEAEENSAQDPYEQTQSQPTTTTATTATTTTTTTAALSKPLQALQALSDRDTHLQQQNQTTTPDHLIVSPYSTPAHLLDLRALTLPNQLLASALTHLRAVRPDYATAPYAASFNWDAVLTTHLRSQPGFHWPRREVFYIVAFRSQIPPATSRAHLVDLDREAHAEAMAAGGLLKYWYGAADEEGRNLATCVWREVADSRAGSKGSGHRRGVKETRALYTEWRIERLRLVVGEGVREWEIGEWVD